MDWKLEYTDSALSQLRMLDKQVAKRILDYMDERVVTRANPRELGKALTGPLGELWRYRIGDFRVICQIEDNKLLVLVVRIGSRQSVYN